MFRFLSALALVLFLLAASGWRADVAAQTISEFPIPTTNSFPQGITGGSDGALWFAESGANQIGRITITGLIREFPIPTADSYPYYITSGPDGALWFTEAAGNKIGQITTAGVIREFPIPTPNGNPWGITSGPDGALWFTESTSNKVGRITTTGVITEFPISTAGELTGITSGPDGALWFVDYNGTIRRITTSGLITEFAVPTPNSGLWAITSGPDGALWFTEPNSNKIGRITTTGEITEFPLPSANSGPTGITAGSDGALWFTEDTGNRIGRLPTTATPANPQITEFPIPTINNQPFEITLGSDGALWFAESGFTGPRKPVGTSMIGRLMVSSPPVVTLNPTNQTVSAGQTAIFSAAASGTPTPTVQWQQSSGSGAPFTDISGATSTTYAFTSALAQSGYQYRAVFTNSVSTATTTAATLTVNQAAVAPVITLNPTSQTVNAGQVATFTAAASGTPTPTVQWQQSTGSGAPFTDISGATSTTYVTAPTTASQNGHQYRAVFSNSAGPPATTTAAILTVHALWITSVSPSTVTGSTKPKTLTINGQNFASKATVTLRDLTAGKTLANLKPTTANSSGTQLTVSATFGIAADNWSAEVINPNGQSSGQFPFQVVAPPTPVLSVTPPNVSVGAAAGTTSFSVSDTGTGTLSYSAKVTAGSAWLSIASGASGGNSGTINVRYSANTGAQRSGTIQVTSNGAKGSPATLTVVQLAPVSCTLSVTPSVIQQGGSTTLSWTSANGTSGTIDNGIGAIGLSGSQTIAPTQTTTYTGTFTGPGGSSNCQATVTVSSTVTGARALGIDVSDGSSAISAGQWKQACASGRTFAIIEASIATTATNLFPTNAPAAVASKCLIAGAYHYARQPSKLWLL